MKLKDFIPQGVLPETEEDAITLLRADHDKVEDLFSSFDDIKYGRADADKNRLVAQICHELGIHAALEEEIFYPAVRAEIADDDLMNEAQVEHAGITRLIAELASMDIADEMLNAKMHVLCAYVKHHVREEEEDMFRKARETEINLGALGEKLKTRRRELLEGGARKPRRTPAAGKSRPAPRPPESRAAR